MLTAAELFLRVSGRRITPEQEVDYLKKVSMGKSRMDPRDEDERSEVCYQMDAPHITRDTIPDLDDDDDEEDDDEEEDDEDEEEDEEEEDEEDEDGDEEECGSSFEVVTVADGAEGKVAAAGDEGAQ